MKITMKFILKIYKASIKYFKNKKKELNSTEIILSIGLKLTILLVRI